MVYTRRLANLISFNENECITLLSSHTALFARHISELSCKQAYRLGFTESFNDQNDYYVVPGGPWCFRNVLCCGATEVNMARENETGESQPIFSYTLAFS